jgi:hypothetical protein
MRIDLYTKTILTLIALLLAVIALKPFAQPIAVKADAGLAGVQFWSTGMGSSFLALDTKTGAIWLYEHRVGGVMEYVGKLTQLGKPITK